MCSKILQCFEQEIRVLKTTYETECCSIVVYIPALAWGIQFKFLLGHLAILIKVFCDNCLTI